MTRWLLQFGAYALTSAIVAAVVLPASSTALFAL